MSWSELPHVSNWLVKEVFNSKLYFYCHKIDVYTSGYNEKDHGSSYNITYIKKQK